MHASLKLLLFRFYVIEVQIFKQLRSHTTDHSARQAICSIAATADHRLVTKLLLPIQQSQEAAEPNHLL